MGSVLGGKGGGGRVGGVIVRCVCVCLYMCYMCVCVSVGVGV